MKKSFFILITVVLGMTSSVFAIPSRDSMKVPDVTDPYNPPDFIIGPTEEPVGDHLTTNAPDECDIRGIISCYDSNKLRVDILLNFSVKNKFEVWYAVIFEYADISQYFTYYPSSNTLVYKKEKDGKVMDTQTLAMDSTADFAGVSSCGDEKNTLIYFVIDKNKHIGGNKGTRYYLTTYFYSGYVNTSNQMTIADETIPVNLYFVK